MAALQAQYLSDSLSSKNIYPSTLCITFTSSSIKVARNSQLLYNLYANKQPTAIVSTPPLVFTLPQFALVRNVSYERNENECRKRGRRVKTYRLKRGL